MTAITRDQVKKIYSGETTNWKVCWWPGGGNTGRCARAGLRYRDTFDEDIMDDIQVSLRPPRCEHRRRQQCRDQDGLTGSDRASEAYFWDFSYAEDGAIDVVTMDGR